MNFMFSWQEQYLTRSLRSLVRYCSCHSNIKSISSRYRVISSIYFRSAPMPFLATMHYLHAYRHISTAWVSIKWRQYIGIILWGFQSFLLSLSGKQSWSVTRFNRCYAGDLWVWKKHVIFLQFNFIKSKFFPLRFDVLCLFFAKWRATWVGCLCEISERKPKPALYNWIRNWIYKNNTEKVKTRTPSVCRL